MDDHVVKRYSPRENKCKWLHLEGKIEFKNTIQ